MLRAWCTWDDDYNLGILEFLGNGKTTSNVFLEGLYVIVDVTFYGVFSSRSQEKYVVDIRNIWRSDLFIHFGMFFTLDDILIDFGLSVRNVEVNTIVPMFDGILY